MSTGDARCAVASLARDEPLAGTASHVTRWLLVESPGAWSGETVPRSRLGERRAALLAEHARTMNARLMLIRRPGARAADDEAPRTVFFADTRSASTRLYRRTAASVAALDEMALDSGWELVPGPIFCVCTHGAHDACCALAGRPAAAELAALAPEDTWECTHMGGDRFAGNVLVLPAGLCYGRVRPQDCGPLLTATRAGLVVPGNLRGRSALAPAAQVAQHRARAALGSFEIGALAVVHSAPSPVDPTLTEVVLTGPGGAVVEVAVAASRDERPARLTCSATTEAHPTRYDVRRIALDGREIGPQGNPVEQRDAAPGSPGPA